MSQAVEAEDLPGISGYTLELLVAEGYSGQVFRALRDRDGRPVALKVLTGERVRAPEVRARFAREAALLAEHPHPCLVPLVEADLDHLPPYLAFEWMGGGDLRRYTKAKRLLPPDRVLQAMARVGRALEHLHASGVVHRDLKPANVLRDDQGVAFLGDLGMGKDLGGGADQSLTASGEALGTWLYMAPEVQAGEAATAASDVFSLAMMTVELLTGALPRRSSQGISLPQSPALAGADGEFLATLRECLRTDPLDRPGSAAPLAARLEDPGVLA